MTEKTQKNVVITGASRGIGRVCALLLDRSGFKVFAGVRRSEDGERLQMKSTGNIVPVVIDVTSEESINNAARDIAVIVNGSGLQGLINNAGIAIAGPLEFIPVDRIREQFEINLFGQISVTQKFLPLIRKGNGRIINMSSKEGIIAMPLVGPYCASKFALEAFSDALRMELKQWNIPVSIIEPGTIATKIIERSITSAEECIREIPQHASELYNTCFDAARKTAEKILKSAIPPDTVAKVVLKALTAKRPKLRYTVGIDAGALSIMSKIVPAWIMDKIILKQMGLG
jgi:NAD(P)-dependent dehydrogenase (short-subunit alcohol dehydrogenase family)